MLSEIDIILTKLEKAEHDAPDGIISAESYSQLLAIYLYQNNLCYAKYLWKRIPESVKSSSAELRQIWLVGQKMWLRDWPGVHEALKTIWSEGVNEIMMGLKEITKERALVLMSEAYSSVNVNTMSQMTGLSVAEAHKVALDKGWTSDGNMIQPIKPEKEQNSMAQETSAEDQLYKLTQFVSFLEN